MYSEGDKYSYFIISTLADFFHCLWNVENETLVIILYPELLLLPWKDCTATRSSKKDTGER